MKIVAIIPILLFCLPLQAGDYWDWWYSELPSIQKCASFERNAKFMEVALENLVNAERSQANAEVFEVMAIKSSECLRSSAMNLSEKKCTAFYEAFIKSPIFQVSGAVEKAFPNAKILCTTANQPSQQDLRSGASFRGGRYATAKTIASTPAAAAGRYMYI